jgi:hypothetical protein
MSYATNRNPFPRDQIPSPVFDHAPELVDLYWTAWRQAWDHVVEREGAPRSPYMDEGFARNTIWIWDTCFMALFCKYAPDLFPGVESFDNFYQPIHDGRPSPLKIQHPDNPPLFSWIELEHARFTGNLVRLRRIWSGRYLQKHYAFFHAQPAPRTTTEPFARYHNDLHWTGRGYLWSGVASGMDNTPRGRGTPPHGYDGHERILWFDALAQQGLAARCIAEIADLLGDSAEAAHYRAEHARIRALLDELYWDSEDGIYHDLLAEDPSIKVKVKTPAAYWPLLAGLCTPEQAAALAAHARDPRGFGGPVPFPSVSRDDPDYAPSGFYWRGGVWLPLAYMASKALERHGHAALADELAARLVRHQARTFAEWVPPTIWECYAPEAPRPATEKDDATLARPDFCGWSALGPISLFIENMLGFRRIDGTERLIEWDCRLPGRVGLRNLRFGGLRVDLFREADGAIVVESDGTFTLLINGQAHSIEPGRTRLEDVSTRV